MQPEYCQYLELVESMLQNSNQNVIPMFQNNIKNRHFHAVYLLPLIFSFQIIRKDQDSVSQNTLFVCVTLLPATYL